MKLPPAIGHAHELWAIAQGVGTIVELTDAMMPLICAIQREAAIWALEEAAERLSLQHTWISAVAASQLVRSLKEKIDA